MRITWGWRLPRLQSRHQSDYGVYRGAAQLVPGYIYIERAPFPLDQVAHRRKEQQVKRRLLASFLACLALLVSTAGISLAAPLSPQALPPSHTQAPLYFVIKLAEGSPVTPGSTVTYAVVFGLTAPAKDVVIQDAFMNGVTPNSFGELTNLSGGGSTGILPTVASSFQNRITVNFPLGDLAAGFYILEFQGLVDANKKAGPGQNVKNAATVYIEGKWKGAWSVTTPVVKP